MSYRVLFRAAEDDDLRRCVRRERPTVGVVALDICAVALEDAGEVLRRAQAVVAVAGRLKVHRDDDARLQLLAEVVGGVRLDRVDAADGDHHRVESLQLLHLLGRGLRAQVAQMFYRLLLEKDVPVTVQFSDVPADAWYATGKDGEKSIVAGKEVTIIDTVTLDGLEKGTKYQLKGWQMLKEENAELLIDGQRVESDYTFTADSEEMKIEMEYTFNASSLGGQNLVTFEELYDLSNEDEPVKVAEHKDIDDEGQTVLITERIISIHTTATSEDGKKEIEAGKDVTIIDTVTLDGLEIGTKYQLKGWQMIKDENAELIINGERVENDYTFTADSESMEVQIAFTFDASELGGKELVTFEELYDLSNPDEPTKVTEHKDIEDDGQTVTITEVPETPEEPTEPEQPTTPDTPSKTTDAPKTGDNTNIALFLGLLVLSGAVVAGTYFFKRRRS